MGVVEWDSDYYGFLIEQGVCSNDIWSADHEFASEIGSAGYPNFFDFLAKVALGIWDDEEEAEPEDGGSSLEHRKHKRGRVRR